MVSSEQYITLYLLGRIFIPVSKDAKIIKIYEELPKL